MGKRLTKRQLKFVRANRGRMSAGRMARALDVGKADVLALIEPRGGIGEGMPLGLREGLLVAAVVLVPLAYARFYYAPLFVLQVKYYLAQALGITIIGV